MLTITTSIVCVAVPFKVREYIAHGKYVPYTAFSRASRLQALNGGDESITISASGALVAKGLERGGEENISMPDWLSASRNAVEITMEFHGSERAQALAAHHAVVLDIASRFNWELAVKYDIGQREKSAGDPRHDYSTLDSQSVGIIATQISFEQTMAQRVSQHTFTSPLKRSAPTSVGSPKRHIRKKMFSYRD